MLLAHQPALCDDVSDDNWTALHSAGDGGNSDIVEVLLQSNPLLAMYRDICGCLPLHLAAKNGCSKAVRVLAIMHPELTLRTNDAGFNAIQLACQNWHHEVVAQLLEISPTLIESVDSEGDTLLHMVGSNEQSVEAAISAGNEKIVKQGLDLNSDLVSTTSSTIFGASFWGRLQIASLLLARRPSLIDSPYQTHTPLQVAAGEGHAELLEMFAKLKPELGFSFASTNRY